MPLHIVATPIGNPEDISLRAQRLIAEADLVIGEESKPTRQLLKSLELQKPIENLNEHSDQKDINFLVEECRTKNVVLVSDAGTPGFCDPGFQLVEACQKAKIPVAPVPGPSSLMTLLSMSSTRIHSFRFKGFLPREEKELEASLKEFVSSTEPTVFMDTPYRLTKVLETIQELAPKKRMLIGLDMTKENELYLETTASHILNEVRDQKREFVILFYGK